MHLDLVTMKCIRLFQRAGVGIFFLARHFKSIACNLGVNCGDSIDILI